MGGAETKCNSPHINGQCSNYGIAIIMVRCSAVLMFQKRVNCHIYRSERNATADAENTANHF